jgi:hypothetical protein
VGGKAGLFLGLVLVLVVLALTACDSIDPTEQVFTIAFHNDLGRHATLRSCGSESAAQCVPPTHMWHLTPGALVHDGATDRGVKSVWTVRDGSRRLCLSVVFHAKYEDVVVELSQAQPCPGRPLNARDLRHGAKLGGD